MYSGARSTGTGKFEESSFPVLCEECLGEEEHLRMMKSYVILPRVSAATLVSGLSCFFLKRLLLISSLCQPL